MDTGDIESAPEVGMVSSPERHDFDYTAFEKEERIGTGGHADVFRVTVDDTPLVLKEPRLEGTVSTDIVDSFVDEAKTWAKLDSHNHVVGVIDWGEHRIPWIALEHMDGGSLTERIDILDTAEALWIGVCLSRAVQHAHRRGVVHLDLKPTNVLFRKTSDDTWDVPKIGDWGLSSYLIDHSGTVEGLTPNYAAPEQFDADAYGGADDFTDRYQLAAVIYEALTGEQAAPGSGATVLKRVLDERVTPPTEVDPTLPEALDPIFEKALSKEKSDRYETIVNFRRDLVAAFETVVDEDGDREASDDRSQAAVNAGETVDPDRTESSSYVPAISPSQYVSPDETAEALAGRVPHTIGSDDKPTRNSYARHARQLAGNIPVPNRADMPLRVTIREASSEDGVTVCRGNLLTGEPADEPGVQLQPSGVSATIKRSIKLPDDSTLMDTQRGSPAYPDRDPVELSLSGNSDDLDVETIDEVQVCSQFSNPATVADAVRVRMIIVDSSTAVTSGETLTMAAHVAAVDCTVDSLRRTFDPETGEVFTENPTAVRSGEAVEAVLNPHGPIVLDPVAEVPELGIFTLRGADETVAIGVVTDVQGTNEARSTESDDRRTDDQATRVNLSERIPDLPGVSNDQITTLAERVIGKNQIERQLDAPLRLPVEDVFSDSDNELVNQPQAVLAGQVVTGAIESGDSVTFQPSDVSGGVGAVGVESIKTDHEEIDRAEAGDPIGFQVDGIEPEDIQRGDICGPADDPPAVAEVFRAHLHVLDHPSVITAGYTPVVHTHTGQTACTIETIEKKVDVETEKIIDENPDFLQSGEAAVVIFEPQKPLSVEPITKTPELGLFAVRDMGQTIAVGAVTAVEAP